MPMGFDFTEACNNHDRNYGTLNFGFDRANKIFLEEMLAVPPQKRRIRGGYVMEKPDSYAYIYYNAVTGETGQEAYTEAQRNAYICKYGKKPD